MPNLLIARVDGIWKAAPANSGVEFVFKTELGTQETAIQQLAAAMQEGGEAVINGAEEIFVIPEGFEPADVVATLFNTTDTLTYVSRIIYGTVGEEFLIDDLEMAGQALMLAIA